MQQGFVKPFPVFNQLIPLVPSAVSDSLPPPAAPARRWVARKWRALFVT